MHGVCIKYALLLARRSSVPSISPSKTVCILCHILTTAFMHREITIGYERVKSLLSLAVQVACVYRAVSFLDNFFNNLTMALKIQVLKSYFFMEGVI